MPHKIASRGAQRNFNFTTARRGFHEFTRIEVRGRRKPDAAFAFIRTTASRAAGNFPGCNSGIPTNTNPAGILSTLGATSLTVNPSRFVMIGDSIGDSIFHFLPSKKRSSLNGIIPLTKGVVWVYI
jgi:hypothetical protein